MPTNLKSLLTRSRSKNELKLRESKDEEIAPSSGNENESSAIDKQQQQGQGQGDDVGGDNQVNRKCHQLKDYDDQEDIGGGGDCGCCSCQNSGSEGSLVSGSKVGGYLYSHEGRDNSSSAPVVNSYSDRYCCGSDESPPSGDDSCYSEESFLKGFNRTDCNTTLSSTMAMMPPGNPAYHHHHHGPYQCCSQQCYSATTSTYGDVAPPRIGGPMVDYSGYFVEEAMKQSKHLEAPHPRMVVDSSSSEEMRRNNGSCRTLLFPSNYETGHHHPKPLHQPPPHEYSKPHHPSSASSMIPPGGGGNVPAVHHPSIHHSHHHHSHNHQQPQQHHHQVGPTFLRTNPGEGCGSSSQNLSMRKCETVLALSSLNNGTISTSAAPITTTSGNKSSSYQMRTGGGGGIPSYSNFPTQTAAASLTSSGGTMSHLSPGVPSTGPNVGGKVRVMKEKIFSTSSSALNCLLHSSSRTGKLFSGWKLSSASSQSSSHNGGSNLNMFGGGSNTKHYLGGASSGAATSSDSNNKLVGSTASRISSHHHLHHHPPSKSRSQLSISDVNSFSNDPAAPLTPINRLRRNVSVSGNAVGGFCPTSGGGGGSLSAHSSYSRSSSVASFCGGGWGSKEAAGAKEDPFEQSLFCRLCLSYVGMEETMEILACSCRYCKDCLISYVSFEIQEGADEIACPDASCEKQGVLEMEEMAQLVEPLLMEKHKKFRLFREVEKDNKLMWCPSPGCETVCQIQTGNGLFVPEIDRAQHHHHHGGHGGLVPAILGGIGGGGGSSSSSSSRSAAAAALLPFINCPTCQKTFCAGCKLSWHPDSSCEAFRRKLIKQGKLSTEDDELFSLDSIKKCPFCHVPIEKDSGCAQMMCKRCKHVFCWYCLASLDDDFLLRHYDKGPCKNKLGHSRASVVWHRAQVIGIFAGFGVLVLLASPLLILAAPCLLCCRCRYCANKLDPEESDLV